MTRVGQTTANGNGDIRRLGTKQPRHVVTKPKHDAESHEPTVETDKTATRRRHRPRPGSVAKRDITMYQNKKMRDVLIRKQPFQKLVREIAENLEEKNSSKPIRFEKQAIQILQESMELELVMLMADSGRIVDHNGKSTTSARDMELISLLKNPHSRSPLYRAIDKPVKQKKDADNHVAVPVPRKKSSAPKVAKPAAEPSAPAASSKKRKIPAAEASDNEEVVAVPKKKAASAAAAAPSPKRKPTGGKTPRSYVPATQEVDDAEE